MARLNECILYRDFEHGEILDKMAELMNAWEQKAPDLKEKEGLFFECANGLVETAGAYGFSGNLWHCYLTFLLVNNENAFSTACEIRGAVNGSINELPQKLRIGVAKDEAFCFFYEDNFRLLQEMGAELVDFSPIHDEHLPADLDGILLYGGYPELNGEALERNASMKEEIAQAVKQGMPCMAECGGFMYLHEQMEDMGGVFRKTCGVIPGKCFRTPRLTRFGYITLTARKPVFGRSAEEIGEIPAHEFHYFDSENCGSDFHAAKPLSKRGWDCIHSSSNLLAGYPHIYYYGNPQIPRAFLMKCLEYHNKEF